MEQRRSNTLPRDTQQLISQFDGLSDLAQNVGENTHVPWNNKNTEFEGGEQIMMGFSYKAVYEVQHTPYLLGRESFYYCTRHSGASPTRKSASQLKKCLTIK